MNKKVFISYSHKDDSFRESLETHLSLLKRNGIVSTWSDRAITPGQKWGQAIDDNLEESDIILFLVSSDFIASDYCIDIEVKRAIEKHKNGDAIVVPIIVRVCDWRESVLGELQALPKEAIAVSKWGDEDEAWLDVVEGLKRSIEKLKERKLLPYHQDTLWSGMLNVEFGKWLDDTEIELTHRFIETITLNDIFVFQDLRSLDQDIDKVSTTNNAEDLICDSGLTLLFGSEQSGKTSLTKKLYSQAISLGKTPVLVGGGDIKSSDPRKVLKQPLKTQYKDCTVDSFLKQPSKLIIIDDYTHTKLNLTHQNIFLKNLKDYFDEVLILADESFQYVSPDIASLDGFSHFEILPFGNIKRHELVKKWVELGVKEEIDENQMYQDLDALKLHIDTLVKNNIVPSKPIFLLTLLQTFESVSPLGIELTSYGHCYQYLIYKALEKAKIRHHEIDSYINCLTEIAGAMFMSAKRGFDTKQFDSFFEAYNKKYVAVDQGNMISNLLASHILQKSLGEIRFKYRYIYYFYAAKYLSESLADSNENKYRIRDLISRLHREDCANIIIFITHHTKDPWIIDEIQLCMMELFEENSEASLQHSDLVFMEDFLKEIPKLVLEQREIERERRKSNLAKDRSEEIQKELDDQVNQLDPSDLLAKVNKTFKSIDIVGQILRNRHGSLDRSTIISLLEQAYGVGLRFLQSFLEISNIAKEEIVQHIEHVLVENPSVDNEKLEKEAKSIYLLMSYGVIYGVIRKIAFSLGAKEVDELYPVLDNKFGTPAVKLINQSIDLQFMKRFDIKKMKQLSIEFHDNPVCSRVLKEIIIQHIYMHHVSYKEKQQISDAVNIPVEGQLMLERQKNLKL